MEHQGAAIFQHKKLAYPVEEAAELLSLSRAQIYRLIDLQELETVKIGKCRRVTHVQLNAFLARMHGSRELVLPKG